MKSSRAAAHFSVIFEIMIRKIFVAIILAYFLCVNPLYGDYNISGGPITIIFEFPDGKEKETKITFPEIYEILEKRPLSKNLYVADYKIDIWIYASLQKLVLPFEVKTIHNTKKGLFESTVTKIGRYKNGDKGIWIYYVNGVKSPYQISTQLAAGVKQIKFAFKMTK